MDRLDRLNQETKGLDLQEKLRLVAKEQNVVFASSFSIEDQLISDFILRENLNIEIFTIDTGRLFPETYTVWHETEKKYNSRIKAYYPNQEAIEGYVEKNGVNAFYDSKDLRLSCCHIRKVEPLRRALSGKEIWLSGIRKEHAASRQDKEFFEYDSGLNIIKFYPLLDFSEDEVFKEIKERNIPFNQLYLKQYPSIGCAPCTRAIKPGEDKRAGRWWWEEDQHKECGLHLVNGKLVRKNANR